MTLARRAAIHAFTSRVELPHDLWETLLSVWRSSAGRHAPPSAALSVDEQHAVSVRVRELSRGFTRDRALAGERYLSDPDLLGAYLLHFWPISYSQTLLCLEMQRRALRAMSAAAVPGPASALDIGAGPGPVSLALLDRGVSRVTACDRSGAALSLARKIAAARGHRLTTHQWDSTKSTGMPRGPFDLIALGHTLNELWAGHPDRMALRIGLVTRLAEELAPGGRILIFEPALKSTTEEAIRVRDGLMKTGFAVELPCIWQQDCPALPEGTCHGEFEWRPPAGMVRLAHAARIGRETLKMAWFILKKLREPAAEGTTAPASPEGGLYRVVSDPLLSKSGRVRYLVCGSMGRFALSAPRASRAPALKPFFSLSRGDGIRFTGARVRESGWGLDDDSRIEIVQRVPRLE